MSKERPSTPPLHEEIDIKNEEAQKWLEKNHGNNKDSVTEIGVNITFDEVKVKLTGSLLISDYSELKSIDLWEGEITELIIKNCPKVEEIEVGKNQITRIVGLENLTNLTILNCTDNEIAELNVSKNTKLEVLRVHDNQNIKLIGLENLPNLEMFSCSQNPLAIIEIVKE